HDRADVGEYPLREGVLEARHGIHDIRPRNDPADVALGEVVRGESRIADDVRLEGHLLQDAKRRPNRVARATLADAPGVDLHAEVGLNDVWPEGPLHDEQRRES